MNGMINDLFVENTDARYLLCLKCVSVCAGKWRDAYILTLDWLDDEKVQTLHMS